MSVVLMSTALSVVLFHFVSSRSLCTSMATPWVVSASVFDNKDKQVTDASKPKIKIALASLPYCSLYFYLARSYLPLLAQFDILLSQGSGSFLRIFLVFFLQRRTTFVHTIRIIQFNSTSVSIRDSKHPKAAAPNATTNNPHYSDSRGRPSYRLATRSRTLNQLSTRTPTDHSASMIDDDSRPKTRRTNCGRPIYRFKYERDRVTLSMPCFEPTCRTCLDCQTAVEMFEDTYAPTRSFPAVSTPSPPETNDYEEEEQPLLMPFKPCTAENKKTQSQLRFRAKKAHASSRYATRCTASKLRTTVLKFDRRSRDFCNAVSSSEDLSRLVAEKETLKKRQTTVLRFHKRREEFRQLAQRNKGVSGREKKLILVLKGAKLGCRWE